MKSDRSAQARIDRVVEVIRQKWNQRPVAGLILGTGSGQIAEHLDIECRLAYAELPEFPRSTSLGHRGTLVCGRLAGRPVMAMQGRFHLYEGHSLADITLSVHVMRRLGVRRLLVSNAAGGVNPEFQVGDLMLIESHIDLFFAPNWSESPAPTGSHLRPGFRADEACDERLLARAIAIGREQRFLPRRGVYVGMLGPCYETRAEYRMCRSIGGDAVGMSTIPEIATASACGIPILAISIITNVAEADGSPPSGHAVLTAAESATDRLQVIVADFVAH